MAKQKKNKDTRFFTIENAIDAATFTNMVALKATEKAFEKGFEVTEKLQSFTDKLLKKGFKFSAKGQHMVFNTLEDTKKKSVRSFKKASKGLVKKTA